MRNEEKLHVVGAGDVLDTSRLSWKPAAAPVTPLNVRAPYAPPERTRSVLPSPPMHYALLLALTWLCGPAALLLTPAGRRHRGWATVAVASTIAVATILVVSYARFVPVTGLATPLAWGALATLATVGGFTAWARAVYLASAALPPLHRLPSILRSRAAVCVLGLLAPGCGLLASGSRLRAGIWLWLLWPSALGAAVLSSAPGMWRHLTATMPDGAATDTFEYTLLLAAAAVAAGLLIWIVQALEGARRLAPVPALGRGRGDWFAVALGVSCAALAVAGHPERVARDLGDAAWVLRADGLTVIPLQLSLAAARLDPSCAEYAVQAIALHEARGEHEPAQALRTRLDQGLATYVALLDAKPAPAGAPVSPAAEAELYYGTMARPRR